MSANFRQSNIQGGTKTPTPY